MGKFSPMKVEAECYRSIRGDDVLERSCTIPAGVFMDVGFLGEKSDIRIAAFCDVEGKKGTVWILRKEGEGWSIGRKFSSDISKKVKAVLYEDENDDRGGAVDIHTPIQITAGQELSIFSTKGPKREISVYLDSDGDNATQTPSCEKDPSLLKV